MLSGGPRSTREVEAAAQAAGISERTLNRARRLLEVRAERAGFGAGGGWLLSLPVKAVEAPEGERADNPAPDTGLVLHSPLPGGQAWETEPRAHETPAEHAARHEEGRRFLVARERLLAGGRWAA